MVAYLFLGFLLIPLIEIGLFIILGQTIGLWPTLLGVLVTALIGSAIIRSQGMSLISDIQRQMRAGALPAQQLFEGLMIGIAGALLLTPGYFTDTMGFLLLIPPLRVMLYNWLKTKIRVETVTGSSTYSSTFHRTVEEDVVDLDQDKWRDR